MTKFTIRVTRIYNMTEETEITVKADTIEAALAKAQRYERDTGLDDSWSETDGGADPDTYEWFDESGTLIGTGTLD
jgi:hypothetical protein